MLYCNGLPREAYMSAKYEFDGKISLRARNALVEAGLTKHVDIVDSIKNGKIFCVSHLGIQGVKDVIVWALNSDGYE